MDASRLVIRTVSCFNTHECFSRFLERRAQFLLSISCCAQQSPGAGTGVTAVTEAPFMYLENAEIVLNGVGLLQVPWSW